MCGFDSGECGAPAQIGRIEGMVLKESQAYFKGDKTPGDVAAIIQNRVELFLDV